MVGDGADTGEGATEGRPLDEADYWLLFESIPIGLFEARFSGRIARFNLAALQLFASPSPGSALTLSMNELFAAEKDWRALAADLERNGLVLGREALMKREGGGQFWGQVHARVVLPPGGEARLFGVVHEITEQKQREERLRQAASNDPLTGLPHRAALMDRLDTELARMRRDSTHRFAVAFIDLDDFKEVNDQYGHMVGDQVLMAVAQRLERGLRPEDAVYRYGGDEFAVVLQGVASAEAGAVVGGRMLEVLQSPFQIRDGVLTLGASVGIRLCTSHDDDPYQLLASADQAMYQAKFQGHDGGSVQVITAS